ncbi:hypothetical protein B484DRAFT_428834 [Ochromonadaceae sp. CCMP2298]|nr:hypothetical protein B484DRAFT_428834 [Ochromonadaceae sp. CCMP2298]|mmetsp:Transcript_3723/g.8031  ORF Transcript_3723/g.8031 Transcript_3723/m.8031 type:complete len:229 (+) Transcript_3723:76-762(+)
MADPVNPEQVVVDSRVARINRGRRMMSRMDKNTFEIVSSVAPGRTIDGCFVCCAAPACCPLLAVCPCCGDAEYIKLLRQASTYIHIRENSIEWNDPGLVLKPGLCCGIDPCMYDVSDSINVVYFDDVMFGSITDKTRTCNECRTCLFGGRGERIRIDAPVCCGCCQRASFPCLCVPSCFPRSLCPCLLRHEIYMEDAQKGLYEIKKTRKGALESNFYCRQGEESKYFL